MCDTMYVVVAHVMLVLQLNLRAWGMNSASTHRGRSDCLGENFSICRDDHDATDTPSYMGNPIGTM